MREIDKGAPPDAWSEEDVAAFRDFIEKGEEEKKRLQAVAKTGGFLEWLLRAVEESKYHAVSDEDLLYEDVTAPKEHPDYRDAYSHFIEMAVGYAKDNSASFSDPTNPFPNDEAFVSHEGSVYSMKIMIGQGTAHLVRELDAGAVAQASLPVTPIADIQRAA